MAGQHLPPDHTRGDESTLGGYMAVHARPAAFEGADGASYSVDIAIDRTGDGAEAFGAYLLFLRWRRIGASGVEGHVESDYLAHGPTELAARAAVERLSLVEVKRTLDELLRARGVVLPSGRRWWDAMKDEA